jgi:hypothetical protein
MNQSLDGYVDQTAFAQGPTIFRLFIEQASCSAAAISPDPGGRCDSWPTIGLARM